MAENRKSDTKSVVLNYERDKRLLDHLAQRKIESEFWRIAGYFYLDFFEWLALQPEAPPPGRPFVYYRDFLESAPEPVEGHLTNPDEIAAAILPSIRQIIEAALETYAGLALCPPPAAGGLRGVETLDFTQLMSADLILE
jgi:hypothetical protein